jgi:hypothetical protein
MLTLQDCLDLCELSESEIAAIAEHEHIPMIAATELGAYLLHRPHGVERIRQMIVDDIAAAKSRGDGRHALVLKLVLRDFLGPQTPEPAAPAAGRTDAA